MPRSFSLPTLDRRYFSLDDPVIAGATLPSVMPGPNAAIDPNAPDAALQADCQAFVDNENRRDDLFGRAMRQSSRDRQLAAVDAASVALLHRIAGWRPTTLAGHCARAAAFVAMDAGMLFSRANTSDGFESRLLAGLIVDLLSSP